MNNFLIKDILAREILDSRGNPTIETAVTLQNNVTGVASVPSGASTGTFEAHELRDGDKSRYLGKGVLQAVQNVNTKIKTALLGKDASKQQDIDNLLLELDNTHNKSNLGANAILSVSLAVARATAKTLGLEFYQYINKINQGILGNNNKEFSFVLPTPMANILNGGAHASNNLDIQEFMIVPIGFNNYHLSLRACAEIFHTLKNILTKKGLSTAVGDEGGFAPNLSSANEALDLILQAIEQAGYQPKTQIAIALDAAATEWQKDDGTYYLPKAKQAMTRDQLVHYWKDLTEKYPIISLEDPLGEEDHSGWAMLTELVGNKVQIVGDDLFVTNTSRIKDGIANKSANSVLIKPNQIGSLTETLQAINLAHQNNFTTVISHRSGETEDTTIADLSVAVNAMQIKTGSISRSDRVAKYNRLLKIEHILAEQAKYAGKNAFKQLD